MSCNRHYQRWNTRRYDKKNSDWVDFKTNVTEASHMGGAREQQIHTVQNVLASLLAACCPTWWWNTQNLYGGGWSHHGLSPVTVDTTNSPQMPEPLTPSHLLPWNLKWHCPRLVNFNVLICTPENDGGESSSWSMSFGWGGERTTYSLFRQDRGG